MSETPQEVEAPELDQDETHPDDQNLVDEEEINDDLEDQMYVDPEGEDGPAE